MVLTHWMTWRIVPRKSESQPNQVLSRTCPVSAVNQALTGERLALLAFWHRSLIVFFHNFYQLG